MNHSLGGTTRVGGTPSVQGMHLDDTLYSTRTMMGNDTLATTSMCASSTAHRDRRISLVDTTVEEPSRSLKDLSDAELARRKVCSNANTCDVLTNIHNA